jgi:hypothetical protein
MRHAILRAFFVLVLGSGFGLAGSATTASPAAAEQIRTPGRFGLGIGSTTLSNGLSAKYFMSRADALQFGLGELGCCGIRHRWHGFDDGVALGIDYLREMPDITRAGDAFYLAWNFGGGLGIGFWDHDHFDDIDDDFDDDGGVAVAATFVLGLEFDFIPIPLDIVLEWRPGFLLVPDFDFDAVDFTAHIRVYF